MSTLTADELMAGSRITHRIEIPAHLVETSAAGETNGSAAGPRWVVVRPLSMRIVQRIIRAAGDDETQAQMLAIQHALVEPALGFEEVQGLKAGITQFLAEEINRISGISTPQSRIEELVAEPLVRATFTLAREMNWSLDQVSELTMGQTLLFLEMIASGRPLPENVGP